MTRTTAYRVHTCSAPMAGKAPIEPMVDSPRRFALQITAVLVPIWLLGWLIAWVAGS